MNFNMFRFAISALASCLILSCAVNAASLQEQLDENALMKRLLTLLESKKETEASPSCNLDDLDTKYWYCYGSTCSYEVADSNRLIDVIYKENEDKLSIKIRNMNFGLLKSVTKEDPVFPVSLGFAVGDENYTVQVNSVTPMGVGSAIKACVNLS